jgi:glutamyl-tRNA synthetase
MGYLPEALLNYLGRMGWSMPDEREKFTLQDMVDNFDIQRVSLGGPVFDVNKLSWLNGLWLRELTPDAFKDKLSQWAFSTDKFDKLVPMIQSRVENFSQVNDLVAFMYSGDLKYDTALLAHKKLTDQEVKEAIQVMLWDLEALKKWNEVQILDTLKASAAKMNLKLKDIMPLVFVIVTGSLNSISVIDAMSLLGPDMTRYRFRTILNMLGGFTEQELDDLINKYK